MVGPLPEEIRLLSRLKVLSLPYHVNIVGSITETTFFGMDHLTHLDLQWCGLSGDISMFLPPSLVQLRYLRLGHNKLTGTVPQEIRRFQEMEVLGLENNYQLRANIDDFRHFKNLRYLYLTGNNISGSLASGIMASWPLLREMHLGHNSLTGDLPHDLLIQQSELKVLDLHGNSLKGGIHGSVFANINPFAMEYLDISGNQLSGTVTPQLAKLQLLQHLDISNNNFIGTLPDDLRLLTFLRYLSVGRNPFNATTIPDFLADLTSLRYFSMQSSRLVGSLPNALANLSQLEHMDLCKY